VRDVCSTALRLREDKGLRVRLPLSTLVVAGTDADALADLVHLIEDEVNVKQVVLSADLAAHATFVLRPNGKVLGPRLGKDMQAVFGAARTGQWTRNDDGTVAAAGHVLGAGDFELALESPEGATAAALRSNDAVVSLDVTITPELEAEGLARDVIRLVQQARKDEDLVVTDRIQVWVDAPARVAAALATHEATVCGETLTVALRVGALPAGARAHTGKVEGDDVALALAVATTTG
jgi:isoleucyl-tRNA synthetase